MKLALEFGERNWRKFLREMHAEDSRLFDEWFALYEVDPWGPGRDDVRAASMAAQMPDSRPADLFYPVGLKDHQEAKERAELVGDPDSPVLRKHLAAVSQARQKSKPES